MERTLCKKCNGTGKRPGLEVGTGSMGCGLPMAVGFALAKKLKREEGRVFVLMSDGELQCGTTWESLLIASHHRLNNLVVIVDFNQLQAMGNVTDILAINTRRGRLKDKLRDFDCNVRFCHGHKFKELEERLLHPRKIITKRDLHYPTIVVAFTEKGYGVSFMRKKNVWHYKAPNQDEYERALAELNG